MLASELKQKSADSLRCKAETIKGTRCKHPIHDHKYCYQHYHLYLVDKVVDFNQKKKDETIEKGI